MFSPGDLTERRGEAGVDGCDWARSAPGDRMAHVPHVVPSHFVERAF